MLDRLRPVLDCLKGPSQAGMNGGVGVGTVCCDKRSYGLVRRLVCQSDLPLQAQNKTLARGGWYPTVNSLQASQRFTRQRDRISACIEDSGRGDVDHLHVGFWSLQDTVCLLSRWKELPPEQIQPP